MSVVPLSGLLGLGSLPGAGDGPVAGEGRGHAEPTERSVRLVPLDAVASVAARAEALGFLPVIVQPPRAADRGQLGLVIEEAVESVLERRGACPPGVGAATDLDSSLGDQLYRARLIEARGLCLVLGNLEGIATLAGALDAEDSAVLRFWLDAPRALAVEVWLAECNQKLLVYGAPQPLTTLLTAYEAPAPVSETVSVVPHAEAAPLVAPEVAASSEAMELSELPPAVTLEGSESQAPIPLPLETPLPPEVYELAPASGVITPPAQDFAEEEPRAEVAPPAAPQLEHGPLHPQATSEWQTWLRELETARGPKPLAAVERMFVMSYVPLRDAYLRGIAPSEVRGTLESWATSFAGSYREAFEAMRVRGKRPTMVLDVPEVAHRIGRLHGARSVQLLLVDGLRFDLGLRVELGLRARLGREVALTERLLLWSGLPSTTEMQLELIGRGADGLKELRGAPESEIPVARGRMARTPRRIKAGHRELLKLDLVEARLAEPGEREAARLDAIGAELTDVVAELCEKLPPRTLLFVFGDHGFCLEPQADGTGALRQGGARPEEVLVPAFAWLVGGVQ
jgi:hypothetical protein